MIKWASKRSIRWRAGAVVLVLSGCESISQKISEKAFEVAVEKAIENKTGGDVEIDTDKQGVSFKTSDGKGGDFVIESQTGKLPESWPKDIPPYPGASIGASVTSGPTGMLMLDTTDSSEKVLAFYKSKLTGMKETANINTGDTSVLTFEEEIGVRQLAVAATTEAGKTMIHLQLSKKGE